jgi:hypothetical protein
MLLPMLAFLRAVPQFLAALGSLPTGPRIADNRPKMSIFHVGQTPGQTLGQTP